MPLAVDQLTPDSNDKEVQDAISLSIEACMQEPTPAGEDIPNKQKWCAGKSYGIARQQTGKELGRSQGV